MHTTKNLRWFALAAALGFAVPAARADMITPDSIPLSKRPEMVGSTNGTPVYADNLVKNQYVGMGLKFGNSSTAITHLNNIAVWAPVMISSSIGASGSVLPGASVGVINYYSPWSGASLTSPGTGKPMTVSSLTVETVGQPGFLSLRVYGQNGQALNITPTVQTIGTASPIGSIFLLWKFTGNGISSFAAIPPIDQPPPATLINTKWGVAGISFTPPTSHNPEPSSLVLAALGAFGLAARFGWRRKRREIA